MNAPRHFFTAVDWALAALGVRRIRRPHKPLAVLVPFPRSAANDTTPWQPDPPRAA